MSRTAHVVVGLAFGDEGKGATVDFLTRKTGAGLVVRYNGGAQAAHNVVTPEGRHHTFAQFGSGTFVPGVRTHLSRYMLVNPLNMIREEENLRSLGITDAFVRTTVEQDALLITPYQKTLNRVIELCRGGGAHGSCGQGIGTTRQHGIDYGERVLRADDLLRDDKSGLEKLEFIRTICFEKAQKLGSLESMPEAVIAGLLLMRDPNSGDVIWEGFREWQRKIKIVDRRYLSNWMYQNSSDVIFEGAQGTLLDETLGYKYPHVTWTNTTTHNAMQLLNECGWAGKTTVIGCLRRYFTRHGAGPFPSESLDIRKSVREVHNDDQCFQGAFRVGHFDMELVKRSLRINRHYLPVDELAISHLDEGHDAGVWLNRDKGNEHILVPNHHSMFLDVLRGELHYPITIEGYGPTSHDRHDVTGKYSARVETETHS